MLAKSVKISVSRDRRHLAASRDFSFRFSLFLQQQKKSLREEKKKTEIIERSNRLSFSFYFSHQQTNEKNLFEFENRQIINYKRPLHSLGN